MQAMNKVPARGAFKCFVGFGEQNLKNYAPCWVHTGFTCGTLVTALKLKSKILL